ncbi:MAG: PAP/fibrillin family protein [Cyanobacteria bacterium J06649_4]
MLSKNDLRNAIAPTNRGISATAADRQAIASIIARVEDANPMPEPLSALDLLAGDWRLLYTTSQELLGIDRFPIAKLGNIYQCIRPEQTRIYNIAEVNTLPLCEGLVSVIASFTPAPSEKASATNTAENSSEEQSTAVAELSTRKVNVQFNRAVFGLQRILGYQSPAQYIDKLAKIEKFNPLQGIDFAINTEREPGWLEVTYLDKDLRIGRGKSRFRWARLNTLLAHLIHHLW